MGYGDTDPAGFTELELAAYEAGYRDGLAARERLTEVHKRRRKEGGRGNGSVYREKSGDWCACVARIGEDGKMRRKKVRKKTKIAAEEALAILMQIKESGRL